MKHLFIMNPAAGKIDCTAEFSAKINALFAARSDAFEIYVSQKPGDCTAYTRAACACGEALRIYACGGDGTLNEVVNGAVGFPNAAVTHYPGGSGNDFIKIFSEPSAFFSLERLLDSEEHEFDLIQVGESHYALNICSIGLDARIGTQISTYKRLPLVNGKGAYILSTIVNVIRGIHAPYIVELEEGERFDGKHTLICIANGRFYGGSFNPVPQAEPDDGLLELLLVKAVSRLTVPRVIGKYQSGRFSELPELITHRRTKSVTIHCQKPSAVNFDGELLMDSDITFRLAEEKIRFFYPAGLTWKCKQ